MLTIIKSLFRDGRQFQLFLLLSISTLFCFSLIGMRLYYLDIRLADLQQLKDYGQLRGTATFFFLIWNLFLAWIPYLIALWLTSNNCKWNGWASTLLLLSWLFFFPNAPYIVTDLLHLQWLQPISKWYDMMMIVSFAWTGLMLGYLSLFEVQQWLRQRMPSGLSWGVVMLIIWLCGIGVYIGRYLRWNTWDIIANPVVLLQDLGFHLLPPNLTLGTTVAITVFSFFLLLGYLMLAILMSGGKKC